MIDRITRNLQRAAERGEENAEREHAGKQPFLVDAERGDHVAVLRRRAHQHAPAGAVKQQPQRAEHHRAEHDQQDIVGRHRLAEQVERAAQAGRATPEQIVRAPDQDHEVFDHQGQAEGREQLEQFGRAIDPAQQHHLDDDADQRDDQRRADDAAPEAERARKPLGEREREIGAEHVEGAMREVHDPGDAEDDRQARSHEKQRGRAGESGQKLREIKAHRHRPAG